MFIESLGHNGLAVSVGGRRLAVDPLLGSGHDCFRPSTEAGTAPGAFDAIVLTSRSPLHCHGPSVAACGSARALIGNESCLRYVTGPSETPRVTNQEHGTIDLEGVTITFLPTSWGESNSALLLDVEHAVWYLGAATATLEQTRQVRRYVGQRRCVAVMSAYVDHLSDVLRGRCRGFPYARYSERLAQAKNLVDAGWHTIRLTGGVRFAGAAGWMNSFCAPVSVSSFCSDLQLLLRDADLEADVAPLHDDGAGPHFDPTLGIGPVPKIGHVDEIGDLLQARLREVRQEPWWAAFSTACRVWRPTISFRVHGESAVDHWLLSLDGFHARVEPRRVERASMYVACSARGLANVLVGRWRAEHAALNGELRTSERLFQVRAGAVRRPTFIGQRIADSVPDRACYLPDPWLLLDLLGGHPIPTIQWATGDA